MAVLVRLGAAGLVGFGAEWFGYAVTLRWG